MTGQPGLFDQHSRRLVKPLLSDIFARRPRDAPASFRFGRGKAVYLVPDAEARTGRSAAGSRLEFSRRLATLIDEAGVESSVALSTPSGEPISDVETYLFRNGETSIVAMLRDFPLTASNGTSSGTDPSDEEPVEVKLPGTFFLYDLREKKALGQVNRFALALNAVEPVIFALSRTPLPAPVVAGPEQLHPGETAALHLTLAGAAAGARVVLHVEVRDPSGKEVPHYSGNVVAPGGTGEWLLPLALNDPVGNWRVRVTDLLSGRTATLVLRVTEP